MASVLHAVAALLAAVLSVLAAGPALAAGGGVLYVEHADWTVTENQEPPGEEAVWQGVRLPDSFGTLRHDGSYFGNRPHGLDGPRHWYRFHVQDAAIPGGELALFLPRYADRVQLYINGSVVARSFVQSDRIEHGWNRPWYVSVPSALLREGGVQELMLGLDAPYTGVVHLSRPRIGAPEVMLDKYRASFRVRIRSAEASAWILFALSAFGIGIWLVRREEVLHLLLGLGSGAFAVRNLHYFVVHPWPNPDIFWWVSVVSMSWAMFFLFLFSFRYYSLRVPWLERVLLGMALGSTLLVAPGIGLDAYEFAGLVYLLLIPVAFITAVVLIPPAWRHREAPQVLLAVGFLGNVLLAVHDLAVMQRWLSVESPYLMPVNAAFLCFCFALALAARYVRSLNEIASANTLLEARVQERQQALETSYANLRDMAAERAKAEERQRLMREIHDGIGAQLVTALGAVEQSEAASSPTARTLRSVIADLKLTVDSLEPVDGDLLSLLGNLRYRLEPQLRQARLGMEWYVAPLPPLDWMQPPHALHVLRLVQEALSNVMQHAGARSVRIATGTTSDPQGVEDGVWLEITDDGCGIRAARVDGDSGPGRGLSNMRSRAQSLGGRLDITAASEGGTRVRLWLPLSQPRRVGTAVTA